MPRSYHTTERFFRVSIILKGMHACLELIGAFLILLLNKSILTNWVHVLTYGELLEDPKDYLVTLLLRFVQTFSSNVKLFLFFYLFFHGAVKLSLIYGLLKKKFWGLIFLPASNLSKSKLLSKF